MTKTPTSVAAWSKSSIADLFLSRVVWLTDERRDLLGAASSRSALVAIIGREHYVEQRRKYPLLGDRELDAVLRQELSGMPATVAAVGAVEGNLREVTFFALRPGVIDRLRPAVWVLPESLLVAATLPQNRFAGVERDGFRYFVASSGVSQPATGNMASAEVFSVAVGLDATDPVVALERGATRDRLLRGMRLLPLGSWRRFRPPSATTGSRTQWRTLLQAAGAALVLYLAIASAYLSLTIRSREAELAALGPQVETLLEVQRDIDRLGRERQGLVRVLTDRQYTYLIWECVAAAWSKGAAISDMRLIDGLLTIRGTAPSATDVLAAIAALPGASDAKFASPVRSGADGGEEFSVSLKLSAENGHG